MYLQPPLVNTPVVGKYCINHCKYDKIIGKVTSDLQIYQMKTERDGLVFGKLLVSRRFD